MTEKSRQILVTTVEKGSPADGKLEPGDVILGVFGQAVYRRRAQSFRPCHRPSRNRGGPRRPAAHRLAQGKVAGRGTQTPGLGSYSETSPYACPKAEKILAQGLAAMLKNFDKENSLHINELALLASGVPEHLDLVRKSAREVAAKTPEVETLWKDSSKGGMKTWHHGYNNFMTI